MGIGSGGNLNPRASRDASITGALSEYGPRRWSAASKLSSFRSRRPRYFLQKEKIGDFDPSRTASKDAARKLSVSVYASRTALVACGGWSAFRRLNGKYLISCQRSGNYRIIALRNPGGISWRRRNCVGRVRERTTKGLCYEPPFEACRDNWRLFRRSANIREFFVRRVGRSVDFRTCAPDAARLDH